MVPHFNKITNNMSIVIGNKTISDIYIENKEVQRIVIGNKVAYEKALVIDHELRLTNISANTAQFSMIKKGPTADPVRVNMEYSIDDGTTWTSYNFSTTPTINIAPNSSIYLRGNNNSFSHQTLPSYGVHMTEAYIADGYPTSLLSATNYVNVTSLGWGALGRLFENEPNLQNVSRLNFSKVTSIDQYALFELFYGCTQITKGVDLTNINSITTNSLKNLYRGCSALNEVYAPNVTTWNTIGDDWLLSVSASGTVYLPSGLCVGSGSGCIPENSTNGIPSGWTYQTY